MTAADTNTDAMTGSSAPLPPPEAREQLHSRTVQFAGFLRADGLWDIEAELTDSKPFPFPVFDRGTLEPNEPIHGMKIRLTIDDEMTVIDIAATMSHVPLAQCNKATLPMRNLIGARMGPGWRTSIDSAVGSTVGCTHLRALLFNAATAAFQTIQSYREHASRLQGQVRHSLLAGDSPPAYLGRCVGWAVDGEAVRRFAPQFYRGAKVVQIVPGSGTAADDPTNPN
jgi:hypothetical protein